MLRTALVPSLLAIAALCLSTEARAEARFGAFAGGLIVPGADISAGVGGLTLSLAHVERGFEPRLMGLAYHLADKYTGTTGGALLLQDTYWAHPVYGFGVGGGVGYATFSRKESSGWDDSSLQVIAYVSPVHLRLGDHVELGLDGGVTRFFAHDVRPFGFLYVGFLI